MPVSPSKLRITRLPLAPRNDAGVNNHHSVKVKSLPQSKHVFQDEAKREPVIESGVPEKQQSKLVRKISILKREKKEREVEEENEENYPQCQLVTRVLTTREIKDTWKAAFVLKYGFFSFLTLGKPYV